MCSPEAKKSVKEVPNAMDVPTECLIKSKVEKHRRNNANRRVAKEAARKEAVDDAEMKQAREVGDKKDHERPKTTNTNAAKDDGRSTNMMMPKNRMKG